MNMSKSRDIQAKMPSPKVIYASNESKSVLARNLEECRDNDKNSQSVILSFKCIYCKIPYLPYGKKRKLSLSSFKNDLFILHLL